VFCANCMVSWPIKTFLQRFPSIVHFTCVDRKMNLMISSSACPITETYLLKQKVCFFKFKKIVFNKKSFQLKLWVWVEGCKFVNVYFICCANCQTLCYICYITSVCMASKNAVIIGRYNVQRHTCKLSVLQLHCYWCCQLLFSPHGMPAHRLYILPMFLKKFFL